MISSILARGHVPCLFKEFCCWICWPFKLGKRYRPERRRIICKVWWVLQERISNTGRNISHVTHCPAELSIPSPSLPCIPLVLTPVRTIMPCHFRDDGARVGVRVWIGGWGSKTWNESFQSARQCSFLFSSQTCECLESSGKGGIVHDRRLVC